MVNVSEIDENYIIKKSHDLSSESVVTKLISDISQATKVETVTGEAIILAAGAAGTTGKIRIGYAPIMDSIGGRVGYYRASTDKDSSLVLSSTALANGQKPLVDGATETGIYSALTNGTYSVDYVNGIIYYKKGTTGTTGTVNYKYTGQELDLSVSSLSIGDVTSNSQNIATEATLGTVNTNLGTIETDIEATNNILTDGTQIAQAYGVYNATEPTLTDGEKVPLQTDSKGKLYVNSGASGVSGGGLSLYVLDSGNTLGHGAITYTSGSTCTITGNPFTLSANLISKLDRIDNTGKLVATYTLADTAMTISSNVLSVSGMSAAATDTFVLYIMGSERTNDISTDAQKTISLVNVWNRYTDAETLVTAQDLTDTYADYGAEIDMRGYTHLRVGIVLDVNDSTDIKLKLLGLNEAGGIDEFEIEGGTTQAIPHTADAKYSYEFDVKGSPFVQLQAKAETVGATPGDLTISITKVWKGA